MKEACDVLVLGAGFSGLSTSYHIGHDRCVILEKNSYLFGHCSSHDEDGVVWDEGPHVSFTKSDYVKELFEKSVSGGFVEYDVLVGNYYQGHWIDHPAQVNLYQVPQPLRNKCLSSMMEVSKLNMKKKPENYGEWLLASFGYDFSHTFPYAYTRKYWTCEPELLETSWVGNRICQPNEADILRGSEKPLLEKKHYITKVRYPKSGGYKSFGSLLAKGAHVQLEKRVYKIDLEKKLVYSSDGNEYSYSRLVSTLPLPVFIRSCVQVTKNILDAVDKLACTSGYLINVIVPHHARRPENWVYVYDEDKISTRITFVDKLDGQAKPKNDSGIQVEVYHSPYKRLNLTNDGIRKKVIAELIDMGLIDASKSDLVKSHIRSFKWGNVIFDHHRREALDTLLNWLSEYGLEREIDDLDHNTNWDMEQKRVLGDVILAGRFGQWKYYWSDDCVLRGKQIGEIYARSYVKL